MAGLLTELITLENPAREPITVNEMMDYLRAVPQDLDFVRLMLSLCREILEGKLGVAFYTQQLQATFQFPVFPLGIVIETHYDTDTMQIVLPRPPVQSIDDVSVETDIDTFESITTDSYDCFMQFPTEIYFYGDAFGNVEYPWWISLNREPRVRVQYTCGYASVDEIPAKYKLLLYKYVASSYLAREAGVLPDDLSKAILAEKVMHL